MKGKEILTRMREVSFQITNTDWGDWSLPPSVYRFGRSTSRKALAGSKTQWTYLWRRLVITTKHSTVVSISFISSQFRSSTFCVQCFASHACSYGPTVSLKLIRGLLLTALTAVRGLKDLCKSQLPPKKKKWLGRGSHCPYFSWWKGLF